MQMSFILTALIIHLSTSFRKAGYCREYENLVCESRIISVCVYAVLAPRLVSLPDPVVCDKLATHGRGESSLFEDDPVSP